jgi:hypothetical protein
VDKKIIIGKRRGRGGGKALWVTVPSKSFQQKKIHPGPGGVVLWYRLCMPSKKLKLMGS